MSDSIPPPSAPSGRKRVLKRAAQFGFLFFLLKGLAWLVVGFLAWKGLT
jgi:hypothetical protein